MNNDTISILPREERLQLSLRSIYESFGYKKITVNKFEPYDLYVDNKSFLNTDKIISFMDLDGRLLSLKPDVTLSIVRKMPDEKLNGFMKVYYNEKVVRLPFGSHEYKEINQTGIELLGEIDDFCKVEVILLALKSLEAIEKPYMLDISHMGFVSGLLDEAEISFETKKKINEFIYQKNSHELKRLLDTLSIDGELKNKIAAIPLLYGPFEETIEKAKALAVGKTANSALKELEMLYNSLKLIPLSKRLSLDFSIVNDLEYYNGIIFQGYIKDLSKIVLKGGNYDNLTRRMGKKGGAIGFAVYTDELSRILYEKKPFDCDALILYDENASCEALMQCVTSLQNKGLSVRAEKEMPDFFNAAKVYRIKNAVLSEVE